MYQADYTAIRGTVRLLADQAKLLSGEQQKKTHDLITTYHFTVGRALIDIGDYIDLPLYLRKIENGTH
ncbi:hypothetical protein [Flexibacterium corallicola]|uniref:hypothetical protein n=1 Tax=Flexibacterium corallicola TaxID=3037259 RepID=UPI00286F59CF|nr:hypothetical protein [Pseudovibrio sp. M1P-2-3]